MFASFFNMLYPSKTFLTSVLNILHYNPSTYDIEELNNQMSSKEECELLNGSVDVSEINKNLSLKNFFIQNILIKKTKFIFKRNFSMEKTKLFFDNIIVDIYQKNQEENKDIIKEEENKEEKKEEPQEDSMWECASCHNMNDKDNASCVFCDAPKVIVPPKKGI